MKPLFTIGYETGGQADLLASLREAGVKTLIDVREIANSRRAGFAKKALSSALADAGIGYVHLRALGTPKAGREANKRGDMTTFHRIVAASLERPEAGLALAEAGDLAAAAPACLLCLEADPARCHRTAIADRLAQARGFDVRHLHVQSA